MCQTIYILQVEHPLLIHCQTSLAAAELTMQPAAAEQMLLREHRAAGHPVEHQMLLVRDDFHHTCKIVARKIRILHNFNSEHSFTVLFVYHKDSQIDCTIS